MHLNFVKCEHIRVIKIYHAFFVKLCHWQMQIDLDIFTLVLNNISYSSLFFCCRTTRQNLNIELYHGDLNSC